MPRAQHALLTITAKCHTRAECVLVDLPVLHDDDEVLRRVFDQLDVGERIAVDEQEVGERAFLDHAELAGIGIALAGQRQQFGVGRRSP